MRGKLGTGAIVVGTVGKVDVKSTKTGQDMVKFGVRTENKKDEAGNWSSKWDNVTCFGDVAAAAKGLEKGDSVLVLGTVSTREHEGKTYSDITAEIVLTQQKSFVALGAIENKAKQLGFGEDVELVDDDDLPF